MLDLVLRTFVFLTCAILGALKPLQILQQTSYRMREFVCALKNKPLYVILTAIFTVLGVILTLLCIRLAVLFAVVYCAFAVYSYVKNLKKPLVFTKRVSRLLVAYAVITLGLATLQIFLKQLFLFVFCPFLTLIIASFTCLPIEKRIAQSFIKKAEKKLNRVQPTVIAITGSYGKTSLKNALAHILKSQYKVCASPKSYNTPMGLARCINENLSEDDEIFIAEAGARYKGDIGEICRFIRPSVAIITAVGNQHLSTFKTMQNLYEEKFSLACDTVKTVFVNVDAVAKIPRFNDNKTVVSSGKEGNVKYESVIVDKTIQKFVVKGKYKYDIECSLLADYVPSMLTLAVAVAEQFQISQKNIKNSIKTLKPIAHRLEILYNDKDVIIDDAYNSNESGFISAINLLSTFEDKVKVVITPGVVELGERQSEVNRNLATYAYSRADYLLTYGVNADAIKSGAKEKCEVYANLNECMKRYKSIQGERAVLFENDLPDTY